jgi:hypothetical protein
LIVAVLLPQAYRLPSEPIAMLSNPAADTEVGLTPAARVITSGLLWLVVVPSPSCPKVLLPQAYSLPSEPIARLESVLRISRSV